MKARPILMSAPMVRGCLEGTKTQTRRTIKPQPSKFSLDPKRADALREGNAWFTDDPEFPGNHLRVCPYGRPGDLLWVRETVRAVDQGCKYVEYLADEHLAFCAPDCTSESEIFQQWFLLNAYRTNDPDLDGGKPVPGIHMPRWVSRLTLEITRVRVERLQQISEQDAQAEGFRMTEGDPLHAHILYGAFWRNYPTARDGYIDLWDEINGEGAWAANPWVWVIEFESYQQNVDALMRSRQHAA